jgi:hypothetical protein
MSGDDEPLVLVFIPALVTLLYKAETDKGRQLTEAEVIAIRDGATCVAVSHSSAQAVEGGRGYPDIVAEDAWNEWQAARAELFADGP